MAGVKLTSTEAYERGLVTRVYPQAEFQQKLSELAQHIASLPPKVWCTHKNIASAMLSVTGAPNTWINLPALHCTCWWCTCMCKPWQHAIEHKRELVQTSPIIVSAYVARYFLCTNALFHYTQDTQNKKTAQHNTTPHNTTQNLRQAFVPMPHTFRHDALPNELLRQLSWLSIQKANVSTW